MRVVNGVGPSPKVIRRQGQHADHTTNPIVGEAMPEKRAMGGRTAHASLIARQMGKPCVVSCAGLEVDAAARRAKIGATLIAEGDWLSIDGARWRQSKPGVPGRPTRARPHWTLAE